MLYSGVADWDTIRKVKAAVSIPVIANGDVFPERRRCNAKSGLERISSCWAGESLGIPGFSGRWPPPWPGKTTPPDHPWPAGVDTAVEQFRLAEQDKGSTLPCLEARKHFAWYLRGVPYSGYYKEKISHISTMADILDIAAGVKRDLR